VLGLGILLVLLLMVAIAIGAGVIAYRRTGKWWALILVALLVLWLPFWDVIPGAMLFHRTVSEIGGVRIFRKVKADGYFEQCRVECDRSWGVLLHTNYRYIEVNVPQLDQHSNPLQLQSGDYSFRLEKIGEDACRALQSADTRTNTLHYPPAADGLCLLAEKHNAPISRYRYEYSDGWTVLPGTSATFPMQGSWARMVDLRTNEVIAQAYRIRYVSWLGRQTIGIPSWESTHDDQGRRVSLSPTDVIELEHNQKKELP
jgi:hypothetical protein